LSLGATHGQADRIELDAAFVNALPPGGTDPKRSRSPFSDEIARALADEENLQLLADHDINDRGVRDIWETIVYTGRRCGEVLKLRLDCIGRYHGLPILWYDQTKVGNYNEAIRIPEVLYDRLDKRRTKSLRLFENNNGYRSSPEQRQAMALFPTKARNRDGARSVSYTFFNGHFKLWVTGLALGSRSATAWPSTTPRSPTPTSKTC
jgi:integrase